MLTITVPGQELFDNAKSEFISTEPLVLELEHSLASLSKWESKYETPFLVAGKKTDTQVIDYIIMMILTPVSSYDFVDRLTQENLDEINAYIDSKQSATTFGKMPEKKVKNETITAELIYYWMVSFNIPFQCETWHLNRLLSLIQVCNVKNSKPKKMSRQEIAARNREINEERKKKFNTSG